MMLIRCGCLELLPRVGFVDLKEQGLSLIARHCSVFVTELDDPAGLPIRTLSEYVRALRSHHHALGGRGKMTDPFGEDWDSAFGIVEDGARIGSGASVHDSVVLRGARVEDRAVVVRSVLCAGAIVRRGQTVVDRVITAADAAGNAHRQ
jgi:hypothetical protein